RILALAHGLPRVLPCGTGGRQFHRREAAQREPAQLAAVQAVEKDPGLCAAVGDAQGEPGETLVEVVGLAFGRRVEPQNSGAGEGACWHVFRPLLPMAVTHETR